MKKLKAFTKLVVQNIFSAGMKDPMVQEINSWDVLFEFWNEYGNLMLHTQTDIVELADKVKLTANEVYYILNLPQVKGLEQG